VFAGKKVLITGGSSGIGKRLAHDFLKLGAHVSIVAHQAESLEKARIELAAGSHAVRAFLCDLASVEEIKRLGADYVLEFGAPDILVNNAGYALYSTVEETSLEEIQRLVSVNLSAALLVTRQFLPSMIQAGSGHVVMMASVAGRVPLTPCGVYSAAKHGLVAAAETLRAELEHFGLRVHVICPGRVDGTGFFLHESFVKRTPRRETEWTLPLEAVSRATIEAIRKRRFFTYAPRSLRPLVWLAHAFPFLSRPLLQRLMRARVKAIYAARPSGEASEDERA
jgi:uncharacterized protein